MPHEQQHETMQRAVHGVAYGVAGAYVGAILFFVTVGMIDNLFHLHRTEVLWARQSLSSLFLFSLAGIFLLSWWIIPVGAFFGIYFCPKLSQRSRTTAVIGGMLLGAALGLLTAIIFALISRDNTPTPTIQLSFAFLPAYCAVWCGGYSWLRAKRV